MAEFNLGRDKNLREPCLVRAGPGRDPCFRWSRSVLLFFFENRPINKYGLAHDKISFSWQNVLRDCLRDDSLESIRACVGARSSSLSASTSAAHGSRFRRSGRRRIRKQRRSFPRAGDSATLHGRSNFASTTRHRIPPATAPTHRHDRLRKIKVQSRRRTILRKRPKARPYSAGFSLAVVLFGHEARY